VTLPVSAGAQTALGSGSISPSATAVDSSVNLGGVAQLTSAAADFGSVAVGQTSSTIQLTFTFGDSKTVGRAPAVLTGGAPALDFADAGTGTCTTNGTPHTYIAGDSCTVDVTFTPEFAGTRNGAVVLQDAGGSAITTAYIHGIGSGPVVAFGPGTITTVAGQYRGAGNGGYSGDGGPAISALFSMPTALAFDGAGNLYVADFFNNVIRRIATDGTITTVAGNGTYGNNGGSGIATSVSLAFPTGVAVDGAGNLYIVNSFVNAVRKVTPAGFITQIAGNGTAGYLGDNGPAASAELANPIGVAVDGAGNLYIADEHNNVIRKVTPGGVITTVAGNGTVGYSGDNGPATSAQLNWPFDVALDAAGNLYIADQENNVIRKVTPGGTITTIAGKSSAGPGYSGDHGAPTNAQLAYPQGLALDGNGNLYIADEDNNVIRKVDVFNTPTLTFASTAPGAVSAPQNVTVLNLGNLPLNISQISTAPNFSLGGFSTSCNSSGQVLDVAANCVLGVEFSPMEGGNISGSVVLTDNAVNSTSATQSIALQGSAPPAATGTTVTGTNAYLTGVTTLTASVSSTTGAIVSGNVTFSVGSTNLGTAPVNGGAATINVPVTATNGFTVGTDTISATFAGNASFAASGGSTSLTVAAPTYTLAAYALSLATTAGKSTTATLNLSSTYYAGSISFVTTISPSNGTVSSVSASAPSVTLVSGGTGTSTLTITTTRSAANHTPPIPWKIGAVLFCIVLPGAPFTIRRKRAIAMLVTTLGRVHTNE